MHFFYVGSSDECGCFGGAAGEDDGAEALVFGESVAGLDELVQEVGVEDVEFERIGDGYCGGMSLEGVVDTWDVAV